MQKKQNIRTCLNRELFLLGVSFYLKNSSTVKGEAVKPDPGGESGMKHDLAKNKQVFVFTYRERLQKSC